MAVLDNPKPKDIWATVQNPQKDTGYDVVRYLYNYATSNAEVYCSEESPGYILLVKDDKAIIAKSYELDRKVDHTWKPVQMIGITSLLQVSFI